MARLYVPIGILGSGKSMWAKKMVAESPNVKIVCPDVMRTMLNGNYQYIKGLDSVIDNACRNMIYNLLSLKFDVVVDCCNLTENRRKLWWEDIGRIGVLKVKKIAVIFPNKNKQWHVDNVMKTEKGKLFDRNYWEKVYDLHKRQFEPVNETMFDQILHAEGL